MQRARFSCAVLLPAWILLALPQGAGSSTAATGAFPVLYVITDNSYLAGTVDPDIDAEFLDSAGDTERIAIVVPNGYSVDLAHAAGSTIGEAYLATVPPGGGTTPTVFNGHLVAMARTAYVSDAAAQACSPGTPTAAWAMQVRSGATSLQIPIGIFRVAEGLQLTLCFDPEHAMGLEVRTAQFLPKNAFATPSSAGKYLFDSIVTPFAPDGTPDFPSSYEMRAYEDLPASMTATADYSTTSKTLTVTGTLRVAGKTPSGATVQVRTVTDPTALTSTLLGKTQTNAHGAYTYTRRIAVPPKYVFSETTPVGYAVCSGSSPAPAGCASYSIDGTGSPAARVTFNRTK